MEQLVLLRNSERSTFRRCMQKWQWSYLRGLEPKRTGKALAFGTMVHVALASWYVKGVKRGVHPAETFLAVYDADAAAHGGKGFDQWDDEDQKVDARELGYAMLTNYVDRWGKDSQWRIIEPEMHFQIDVYDKKGDYLCTLVGSIDGVAANKKTGRTTLLEHKTAKTIKLVRINSGYGEQGLTYWWAATIWLRHLGLLKQDELLDGVMYNFLRKGFADTRPRNADGYYVNKPKRDDLVAALAARDLYLPGKPTIAVLSEACVDAGIDPSVQGEVSKNQTADLFGRQEMVWGPGELRMFENRLRKQAYHMRQVRNVESPAYKNPTMDCDWDCPFKDACEVHEMGGDFESILEFDFKPWNPYEEHELLMEHT